MDQTTTGYVVAEFDFAATDADELSFSAGDIIRVVAKHNDDWWEGQLDGKTGMFPKNRCVETTLVDPNFAEDNTQIPTPSIAYIGTQSATIKSETREPDAPQLSPAGGQWKQATNLDGATYYYNTATQETSWDLPGTTITGGGLGDNRRPSEVRAICKQKCLPDYPTTTDANGTSVQSNGATQEISRTPPGKSNSPSSIETNGRTSRPVSLYSTPPPTTPPVIPSLSPAKQKRTSMLLAEVIPPIPDVVNDDDVVLDAGGISLKSPDVDDEEDINSNPSGAFIKFDDEEGAMFDPLSMDYVKKEGGLNRKLEKLEGGKPASRQSWKMVYTAIGSGYLLFFKDKISKLKKSDKMVRPLGCFDLQGVLMEQATKANTKKKNVFVLTAPSGEQLLFQADNEQDMNSWLEAIRQDRQRHANDSSMEPVAAVVGLIRNKQMERDSKVAKLKQLKGKGSNSQVLGLDDVDKGKEKKVKTRGKRGNSIASQASCNSDYSEDAQDKQKVKSKLGRFFSTRPTLDNLKEKGILAQESVFGGDLDCEGRTVPGVVELCVKTVEERGLDCVGIYRLSGNAASIQKLRFAFNQDEDVKLEREQDVNVVAGVLKLYFRELSNPLMTFECYDMLIEAAKLQDYDSRMLAIKDLVHTLPKPNFDTLQYLMEHLVRVAARGDVNKMEPSNLAIVFGPTLMRPREETFMTICNTGVQNSVIESMILQCDWMFKKT